MSSDKSGRVVMYRMLPGVSPEAAPTVELGVVEVAGRWFPTERLPNEPEPSIIGFGHEQRPDAGYTLLRLAQRWMRDGYVVVLASPVF